MPPASTPEAKESSPSSIMAPLPDLSPSPSSIQIGLYASRTVRKKHTLGALEHGILQTAGKRYLPHGTPHLGLGRKPSERAEFVESPRTPLAAADRWRSECMQLAAERTSSWPAPGTRPPLDALYPYAPVRVRRP